MNTLTDDLFGTNLDALPLAVFDLETTGLAPSKERIIQVAVVSIDNNKISDQGWSQLVNPGASFLPLRPRVEKLTGISSDQLVNQPDMSEVLDTFNDIVGTRVVVGHNVSGFDLKFLRRAEQRHGVDVQTDYYIDTLEAIQKLHGQRLKLSQCADLYHIDYDENKLHDALVDTKLCAAVWLKIQQELLEKEIYTFGELISFLEH